MSIQSIINGAVNINVNRTKTAGSSVSRNGRYKTGQIVGNQPFLFGVEYRPVSHYTQVRGLLEEIDRLDIIYKEDIEIGSSNSGLSWITAYQGDLTSAQLAQIQLTSTYSGQTFQIDTQFVTGSPAPTDYVFKKGDYVQFNDGYKYPYTVTQDVQFGSSSLITVTVNRPIIIQSGYTISNAHGILVGNAVTWQVKMLNKPTYQIQPDRFVQFSGNFDLIEVIDD